MCQRFYSLHLPPSRVVGSTHPLSLFLSAFYYTLAFLFTHIFYFSFLVLPLISPRPFSFAPFSISYSLFFVSSSFSVFTHTPVHTPIRSYIPHLTIPATCALSGDLTQTNVLLYYLRALWVSHHKSGILQICAPEERLHCISLERCEGILLRDCRPQWREKHL